MKIEELHRLSSGVEPIALHDVPRELELAVIGFNCVVSKFREQVVVARNHVVAGTSVPPGMAYELRSLSAAVREERGHILAALGRA